MQAEGRKGGGAKEGIESVVFGKGKINENGFTVNQINEIGSWVGGNGARTKFRVARAFCFRAVVSVHCHWIA